jgi:hypothetical protein
MDSFMFYCAKNQQKLQSPKATALVEKDKKFKIWSVFFVFVMCSFRISRKKGEYAERNFYFNNA